MAIDIYAVQRISGSRRTLDDTRLELKAGGVWEYLEGYFSEIEKKTGLSFDPYGDTYLHPDHVKLMLSSMERAKQELEKQPKEIKVVLGRQFKGGPEITTMVRKSEISAFISAFQELLNRAIEERLEIGFIGD